MSILYSFSYIHKKVRKIGHGVRIRPNTNDLRPTNKFCKVCHLPILGKIVCWINNKDGITRNTHFVCYLIHEKFTL